MEKWMRMFKSTPSRTVNLEIVSAKAFAPLFVYMGELRVYD